MQNTLDIQHDKIELYNTPPNLGDIKLEDIGLYKTLLIFNMMRLSYIIHLPIWVILNWRILSDTKHPLNLSDIKLEDIE